MTRFMKIVAIMALGIANFSVASAATPPFAPTDIAIAARDQNVSTFLADFYGKANLRVKISPLVTGKINGSWRGPPGAIWKQLSQALNIVAHYDGVIVRIYAASEITSRTIPVAMPGDVVRQIEKMRLVDPHNAIKAGSGSVVASGVPYFVDQVSQLAQSVRTAAAAAPPVVTVTPTTGGTSSAPSANANQLSNIVSPRTALPAGVAQAVFRRSQVIQSASARSPYEVRVFYLQYAKADDTVVTNDGIQTARKGVASILRGMMGDGRASETLTVTSSGNADLVNRSQRDGSRELIDVGNGQRSSGDGGRGQDAGSRDVNGPRIEVDASNNAVIVRDRPEAMGTYEGLIKSFDIEPRIIEIEATIIELDITRVKKLGLDLSFNSSRLGLLFGGQAVQGNTQGSDFSGSFLTGAGGLFQARIDALEQNGTLRITQRPRIIALNNQEATFDNQTTLNVRVSGERDARLFEISYGIVLRVTPSVIVDGDELRTRMSVVVQDGKIGGFSVDGIPSRSVSNLSTETIIKQGESLLIGGMTIDSEIDSRSKTPILGDVPVVGNAFKKRRSTTQHLERLILITPRIISQNDGSVARPSPTKAFIPIPLDQLQGKGQSGGKTKKPKSQSRVASAS